MSNLIDLFKTTKLDEEKIIGENNYFVTSSEIVELNKSKKRFLADVDYSDPKNFARFGSAEEYYKTSINYINSTFPQGKSRQEKLEWINSLSDFDYYLFNNEYPKINAHLKLSGSTETLQLSSFRNLTSSIDNLRTVFGSLRNNYSKKNLNLNGEGFTFETWFKYETGSSDAFNLLTLNTALKTGVNYQLTELLKIYHSSNTFYVSGNLNTAAFSYQTPYNDWNHYAFRVSNNNIDLFVNGEFLEQKSVSTLSNTGSYSVLRAGFIPTSSVTDASAVTNFSDMYPIILGGAVNASLYYDESRFWLEKRTPEEIGRNWFVGIDGNYYDTDSKLDNLLVYYKFHEEFTDYNNIVLDFSGYDNHSVIANKSGSSQVLESAINQSGKSSDNEQPTPIIAPAINSSELLTNFYNYKVDLGKEYDFTNIHALYKKFPSWILEEESDFDIKHLKQIVQIISVYFDDLYGKISELSKLKHIKNSNSDNSIYPFYDTILSSTGFDTKELFNNLDVIEKLLSRQNKNVFDQDTQKVKNYILQNLYNNLTYILKGKGTEKSIRTFLKAYGVNENLIRINLYADKSTYTIQEKNIETVVKKKTLTLVNDECVFLSGSGVKFDNSGSFSLETSFTLPQEAKTVQSSSLFGLIGTSGSTNYNIYVGCDYNLAEQGWSFYAATGSSTNKIMQSQPFYADAFDNTVWNLALRMKPDTDCKSSAINYNYSIGLFGVNNNTANPFQFSLSSSLPTASFNQINDYGSFKPFIGALNNSFSGSLVVPTYQKCLNVNLWNDYLEDEAILAHNKDITNYGFE